MANWKVTQGWKSGVVTHVLPSNGHGNGGGKVNDYTALPDMWKNGKKFETEEPRSYGGTSRWFGTLDTAKKAVEQAVEKDQAYWAAKVKDSSRRGAPARLHRALDAVLDSARDDNYTEGICGRCGRKREECERLRKKYGKRCVEIPVEARDASSDLKNLSDQYLRDLLRLYRTKADKELPLNDPSWPHVNSMLKKIDEEFKRRAAKFAKDRILADCLDCGVLPV